MYSLEGGGHWRFIFQDSERNFEKSDECLWLVESAPLGQGGWRPSTPAPSAFWAGAASCQVASHPWVHVLVLRCLAVCLWARLPNLSESWLPLF